MVGVYSNECVSTAIRDACDRGSYVTLTADDCTAVTLELQRATNEAIAELQAVVDV